MDDVTPEAPPKRKPGRPRKDAAPQPAALTVDDLAKLAAALKDTVQAPPVVADDEPPRIPTPKTPEEVAMLNDQIRDLGTDFEDPDISKERRELYKAIRASSHVARCPRCWEAKQAGKPITVTIDVPHPKGAGRQNASFRINGQFYPKGQHVVKRCEAATLAWLIDQNYRVDRERMGPNGDGEGKVYRFDLERGIVGEMARVIRGDD
jgi:hypothetical protein